ncbi:hypothetical protein MJO29_016054, partial [Puccinia striiformis f. sp. tritici]
TPNLSYNHDTLATAVQPVPKTFGLTSRATIIRLGIVTCDDINVGTSLKVILTHHDWDSEVGPCPQILSDAAGNSMSNMLSLGRDILSRLMLCTRLAGKLISVVFAHSYNNIAGRLVDFEMDTHLAVVAVSILNLHITNQNCTHHFNTFYRSPSYAQVCNLKDTITPIMATTRRKSYRAGSGSRKNPEMTIPASAPGESGPLAANTNPIDLTITVNPVVMTKSRRESITNQSTTNTLTSLEHHPINNCSHSADLKIDQDPVTVALKQFANDDRHFSLLSGSDHDFQWRMRLTVGILISLSPDHTRFRSFKTSLFITNIFIRWKSSKAPRVIIGNGTGVRFTNRFNFFWVGFMIGLQHPLDIFILTFFVCAGLTRLARFNSTASFNQQIKSVDEQQQQQKNQKIGKKNKSSNSFKGLPIPTSLWLVAGMYESIRRAQIKSPLIYLHLLSDQNSPLSNSINPVNSLWLKNIHLNGNILLGGLVKNLFGIQVHWFSFAFAGWAFLMLSKTFRGFALANRPIATWLSLSR